MKDNKLFPFFDKTIINIMSCKTHPFSYVGIDKEGNWLKECFIGIKQKNKMCEIVKNSFLHEEV